jgi:ATP-binding cassette subfamily B protein/ATP-binding cassette subfamily C protein
MMLAVVAALSLVTAVGTLAQPLLVRRLLVGVGVGRPVGGHLGLLVGVLLAVAAVTAARSYLLQRTAEGLVLTSRRRLAGHLLRLPIVEYDQRRTGDLLSRFAADTTLLRAVLVSALADLATGAVVVAGAATVMVVLDPLMFAVALSGLLGLAGAAAIARRVRGVSVQAQARVGEMTSALARALSAVRTIRAARAEQREIARVVDGAHQAYLAGLRMAKLLALVGPLGGVAMHGALLSLLGIGGARVATGAMSLVDLVAVVLLGFVMTTPLLQALGAYTRLQAGLGALHRIEEVLMLPTEAAGDGPTGAVLEPVTPAVAAVEFDRVGFAYAGGEPVLREVSFTVDYGTRTAVVGPSGAGKSTLLALLERFYDPVEGTVRVGGVDVRDLPRQVLRSRLGYVEQEAPVLAGTIRDNLLLAAPDAAEAQLRAALAAVNLAEIAERTPDGLDAEVGERGVLLSGGERQRLAIARALLAEPPILLLDEPTSHLDARNELALKRAIDAVSAQRTLIVVAHRLATVASADQIIVLDRGRVTAIGRHEELTGSNPLYREFAARQLLLGVPEAA